MENPYDVTGGDDVVDFGSGTSKGLMIGFGVGALVLLFGAAGLFFILRGGNDPQGVVEKFVKAYDTGQCEKAVGYWADGSADGLQKACESAGDDFDVVAFEVTEVRHNLSKTDVPAGASEVVSVEYSITLAGAKAQTSTFNVAKFGGRWKIVGTG